MSKDETKIQPEKTTSPKLCPYRKHIQYYQWSFNQPITSNVAEAQFAEEDFLECLEEQCMCFVRYVTNGYGPICNHK